MFNAISNALQNVYVQIYLDDLDIYGHVVVANNLCTTIIWCIVQVWYGERAQYNNIIFKYISAM